MAHALETTPGDVGLHFRTVEIFSALMDLSDDGLGPETPAVTTDFPPLNI